MTQARAESKSISRQSIRQQFFPLLPWLLCGCITELLYLLIVAVVPLEELHFSASPLATAWPWTLAPSHLLFAGAWAATPTPPAQNWPYLALLSLSFIALMGVYVFALRTILRIRSKQSTSRRWLFLVLAGTLIFGVTLLFQPALFSDDVFTYIFSGRILTIYHADPMNTAPIQFLHDPYLQWVISGRNTPNIYGPFWLCIASLLVGMGKDPVVTLLLFKAVALLSHVLNCLLLWGILGKIAPTRRLLGTLLYAWNPLALIELAGSGHSEGILISLLLLAVWLYVSYQGRWHEIGALVLFGFAISMNLIVLLIAPLFIWFLVRTEQNIVRALWGSCWRSCLSLSVTLSMYIPFWRGASTFFAITSAIDMEHFLHSPVGLLTGPTRWIFGLVALWSNFPPIMQPTVAADVTLRASAIFIFALIYARLFGKVRNAITSMSATGYSPAVDREMQIPRFDVLLESWSIAVFWYLVLVLGWFWPWYLLWALWIVAMRCFDVRTVTIALLSGTALLTYPLLHFTALPLATYQPVLTFGIPLVYLLLSGKRRIERNMFLYE